eukprot:9121453-Karenia_brevis.AAC.1
MNDLNDFLGPLLAREEPQSEQVPWHFEQLVKQNQSVTNPLLDGAKKYCEKRSESFMHWVPGRLKVGGLSQKTYVADCPSHKPE